ncbi:portal protein [Kaistia terrae]|uniref:Portal protein n=1 Tax=Kaistia terrae TaxID=537017 RepID=A0ABW0Q3Q0_9HYPH|nr:hypothetical protein [Kaistia terrae]MCX5581480.1 hypothetical protein [Kaistia terrae]
MAKMSDTELTAMLSAERADALSAENASKLSSERSKAMDYYLGDMAKDMPAPADRSKAVSTDVADVVEGLMPSLMEIFASGEDVVVFEPVGPDDVQAAEQETDYVNHVFMQKNPGFLILYSFIKDALLSKNGVVKVSWQEHEEEEEETFQNVPDDVFSLLVSDPSIEVVEHTENPDEATGQTNHDVTLSHKRDYGCARVEVVAPENFGISRSAKTIQDSGYCFHEELRSQSDIIADGFDEEQVKSLPTGDEDDTEEAMARDTVDDTNTTADSAINDANRQIRVTEHYVRMDYEDNGKVALWRVTTAGEKSTVLMRGGKPAIDKMSMMPFASMTPIIMTHRFYGRSVADLVMDIQLIKTALQRSLLDNAYMANNQRMEIADSHAGPKTIDDLLTNRPGGIVRTKQPGGLVPIPNQPIGDFVYPMMEYMDATREWRTGVTRQGQGIDADALQNQTAAAVTKVYSAAQARMRLIARIFAETGIKDMFHLLHGVIRKHDRQENTVRLRGEWVTVDPRNWKTRNDLTVDVGLGSGSKEAQMAFLDRLLGFQGKAIMAPEMGLVKPENMYNSLKKWVELGGLKNVDLYVQNPAKNKPPEKPPSPEMLKLQAEQQQSQAEMQMKQQQSLADNELKMKQLQSEMEMKRYQIDAEIMLKREQAAAELQLKRELGFMSVATNTTMPQVRLGGDAG